MNLSVVEAAKLLGAELSYLNEEESESAVLGRMRVLTFRSVFDRVLTISPGERGTIFILSDEGRTLQAHFTIKGACPSAAEQIATYLEAEPLLVEALRGGCIPKKPFDWDGYR